MKKTFSRFTPTFLACFSLIILAPFRVEAAPVKSHTEIATRLKDKAKQLGFDLDKYQSMLNKTAEGLIDHHPGLGPDYPIWVIPSRVYPEMYSRDSFWTLAGYGNKALLNTYVEIFSRNAQSKNWEPALRGQLPTFVRKNVPAPAEARRPDESALFWILGAYLSGKTVMTEPYLESTNSWLKTLVTPNGFAMVSHGWIDAWEPVKYPVVSANNQGLYAVTLRALRHMGAKVSNEEIKAADAAYRNLAKNGRLQAYEGSSVIDVSSLMGEALSLYFWGESLLSDEVVLNTVNKFAETFYPDGEFLGYKCLSNEDGTYLKESDFWEIAERDPGNYQNGGSWILYEALALYAASRHTSHNEHYLDRFIRRLHSETKYEYSSKELICTGGTCGACTPERCSCPNGKCGAGSFPYARSGYGWNLFINRLLTTDRNKGA